MTDLELLAWPRTELHKGLPGLIEESGLAAGEGVTHIPVVGDNINEWLEVVQANMGVDWEPVDVSYAGLEEFLGASAPALLHLGSGQYLLVIASDRRELTVLARDLVGRTVPLVEVAQMLSRDLVDGCSTDLDGLVDSMALAGEAREKAVSALRLELLGASSVKDCWLLRMPPRHFSAQLQRLRAGQRLSTLILAHLGNYLLMLLGWWSIGYATLSGFTDKGWLLFWGLLLATELPFRLFITSAQGLFAIDLGILIKRNLMFSALTADFTQLRRDGSGKLLSRALDVETVESAALQGGFTAVFATLELLLAAVVLALGARAGAHIALLVLIILGLSLLCWRQYTHRQQWTDARLSMSQALIERVVGHRTRLVQCRLEHWHNTEDTELSNYCRKSAMMDRSLAALEAIVPRAWLLMGLALLAPAVLQGGNTALMAISIGGLLLAYRALEKMVAGFDALATACIAWQRLLPMLATSGESAGPATFPGGESEPQVLRAKNLGFTYEGASQPSLAGCTFSIAPGDRILVQGQSGSGKSTFGKLLAGIYQPDEGLLLLKGRDFVSLGRPAWRRQVASAPQFHENHIFTESFAFNLLLGGQWPPTPEKWQEAEDICREIGLGPLLDRMPGGMTQTVGETGWRLSHGECSRVYVARTLLQGADIVVLDESFAALDPQNLRRALDCVIARSKAFVLIAHP